MEKYSTPKPYISTHTKNNILSIISQEASRHSMTWKKIVTGDSIKIPYEIEKFLTGEGNLRIYLAGGAIVSILQGRTPIDWDLFFVGSVYDVSNFLEKIKENNYVETSNSITITCDNYKIQFIKRVYDNMMHIIGGFDIDASRLIYDAYSKEVITTPDGLLSHKNKVIYINPYSMSLTYKYRLWKYKARKDFNIKTAYSGSRSNNINLIISNKVRSIMGSGYGVNDYDHLIDYRFIEKIEGEDKNLLSNFIYLIQAEYHGLFVVNQQLYTIDDFIRISRVMYKHIYKHIILKRKHVSFYFVPKLDGQSIYYSSIGSSNIIIHDNYTFTHTNMALDEFYENIIKSRYENYKKITDTRITNVTSQFSGSFQPIQMPIRDIFNMYISHDIYIHFPIIFWILSKSFIFAKKYKLPRLVRLTIIVYLSAVLFCVLKAYIINYYVSYKTWEIT